MNRSSTLLISWFLTVISPMDAFAPVYSLRRSSSFPHTKLLASSKEEIREKPSSSPFENETIESSISSGTQTQDDFASDPSSTTPRSRSKRKIELTWCNHGECRHAIREKVLPNNHIELGGPATGQVVYNWEKQDSSHDVSNEKPETTIPAVLFLVKLDDKELTAVAASAIEELIGMGVQVLVDDTLSNSLNAYTDLDLESDMIRLFRPKPVLGFGSGEQLKSATTELGGKNNEMHEDASVPADLSDPDLIVALGGDGTIMHAAHVFSGPVPPILPIAGGSLGFLTPFAREEILDAILIALGLQQQKEMEENDTNANGLQLSQRSNNNMLIEDISRDYFQEKPTAFGRNAQICISMRMRLDCRIFGSDGTLRSRYNVLNEVVIDRGSSPYLASLECFCDNVHLTTVAADGIIFATPTGSTAYSMAAGGSVVHPAVPSILVTPICPHVLSFRSMIFPDHVVLRCYVPEDARSTAHVYFDGRNCTELQRGDSVQIEMSAHPVPTINRADHSSDWLSSLKQNFNFNTRVRQKP